MSPCGVTQSSRPCPRQWHMHRTAAASRHMASKPICWRAHTHIQRSTLVAWPPQALRHGLMRAHVHKVRNRHHDFRGGAGQLVLRWRLPRSCGLERSRWHQRVDADCIALVDDTIRCPVNEGALHCVRRGNPLRRHTGTHAGGVQRLCGQRVCCADACPTQRMSGCRVSAAHTNTHTHTHTLQTHTLHTRPPQVGCFCHQIANGRQLATAVRVE